LFAWSDRLEWNCGPYNTSVKEKKHGERERERERDILVRKCEAKKNLLKILNVDEDANNMTLSGSED